MTKEWVPFTPVDVPDKGLVRVRVRLILDLTMPLREVHNFKLMNCLFLELSLECFFCVTVDEE